MSLETYKVLHLFGIFLTLASLGANLGHAMSGGDRASNRVRGLMAAGHGIGLLLVLVAGFGMLAKLGMSAPGDWGGWVHAKLTIWVLLGGAVALVYRGAAIARALWVLIPVLAALAGWLALAKPF